MPVCEPQGGAPLEWVKGWEEAQLGSTPMGHKVKVRVAQRLQRETTVPYGWVTERLKMGSRSHVSSLEYGRHE